MLDEFGCRFLDAAFWVHEPEDKETSIAQQVELEKEKWLHEYSLNYPELCLIDIFQHQNLFGMKKNL